MPYPTFWGSGDDEAIAGLSPQVEAHMLPPRRDHREQALAQYDMFM